MCDKEGAGEGLGVVGGGELISLYPPSLHLSLGDTDRFISTIAAVHSFKFSSLVLKNPDPKLDPYPLSTSPLLSLVLLFLDPEDDNPAPGTSIPTLTLIDPPL